MEEKKDETESSALVEKQQEHLENLLITTGVLIPANDLVHYITRNVSYLKLINSEQFKESGIKLEEILDDEFIQEQLKTGAKTAEVMRFVTEKIIPLMQEVATDLEEIQMEEAVATVGEMIK